MKPYLWAALWLLLLACDGFLAGSARWAGALPLTTVLIVAPLLWVGDELANRLEALGSSEERFTGARR